MEKIEILGAGYIGLPLAATFSQRGEVILVEKDKTKFLSLEEGSFSYEEKDVDALLKLNHERITYSEKPIECKTIILAVQTPVDKEGNPNLAYVESALADCSPHLKEDTLLILESTVPLGTCRKVEGMLKELGARCLFAYCPETILPGRVMEEIKNNPRVIGGDEKAGEAAKRIYEKICKARIDLVSFEEAELVKLVENAKRDVDLAFANQIAEIAGRSGVDPYSLIEKVNAHPRVHVLNPGSGVGGHCIAVDPLFLIKRFGEDASLLKEARRINDRKPILIARKVDEMASKGEPIVVFGLSYKKDVDDLRNSSGIAIAHYLQGLGHEVYGCEPNSRLDSIEGIRNLGIEGALNRSGVFVIAQAHSLFLSYVDLLRTKKTVDAVGLLR